MSNTNQLRERNMRKKRAMLRKTRNKISVAFFVIIVILLVIVGRIIMINYDNGDAYSKIVMDKLSYRSTALPYKRGQIVDCNGTVLAYSEKVYNLILDPKMVLSEEEYKEPTFAALVQCFNLERENLETILQTKPSSQYEKLLKELSADDIAAFQALQKDTENNPNIKGVWFEQSYLRRYPFNSLASDVIGFSTMVNGGEIGLESYYNNELSGTDGMSYSYVGEDLEVRNQEKKPIDGYNIITTLDYRVQDILEKNIKKLYEERPAKNIGVIAMNPKNGEILGMASYPTFDLNNPRDLSVLYTEEEIEAMDDSATSTALFSLWNNFCVSEIYEPGSTFKPFTVAAGLEEGIAHDGDTFQCNAYEDVTGVKIRCHSSGAGGHGEITLEQSLMESCNPAMIQIATKLGAKKWCVYQTLYGFGAMTNIDLPREEAGVVSNSDMLPVDLACNSFGQTINVNMVQMAAAFSSIINGGNYYQPHVVKRIEKDTGEVVKNIEPLLIKQTVTENTSSFLRKYLKSTVDEGLAKKVSVTGYSIGGKTGTAQKYPRADLKWLVSFIGCAPSQDPQVVLYTVIDEPYETTGTEGTTSDAQILSKNIFEELLPYLNIFKDINAEEVDTSNTPDEGMVAVP